MYELRLLIPLQRPVQKQCLAVLESLGVPRTAYALTETKKGVIVSLYEKRRSRAASLEAALIFACPEIKIENGVVKKKDWFDDWQQGKALKKLGKMFYAVPEDFEAESVRKGFLIRIPLIESFGSGDHPSTRIAIQLLEDIPCAGKSVLDAGTGCGLLAAAAEKMGAREIVAVDNSARAVRDARRLLRINECRSVRVHKREISLLRGASAADVVISNLPEPVMKKLAVKLMALVRPGGRLILSGLHQSCPETFRIFSSNAVFRCTRKLTLQGWCGAVYKRKAV